MFPLNPTGGHLNLFKVALFVVYSLSFVRLHVVYARINKVILNESCLQYHQLTGTHKGIGTDVSKLLVAS